MKNVVELTICGRKLVVKSDETREYVRKVEEFLNRRIDEIRQNTRVAATVDLVLLTALNLSGELVKIRDRLEKLDKRSTELARVVERLTLK